MSSIDCERKGKGRRSEGVCVVHAIKCQGVFNAGDGEEPARIRFCHVDTLGWTAKDERKSRSEALVFIVFEADVFVIECMKYYMARTNILNLSHVQYRKMM